MHSFVRILLWRASGVIAVVVEEIGSLVCALCLFLVLCCVLHNSWFWCCGVCSLCRKCCLKSRPVLHRRHGARGREGCPVMLVLYWSPSYLLQILSSQFKYVWHSVVLRNMSVTSPIVSIQLTGSTQRLQFTQSHSKSLYEMGMLRQFLQA